MTKSDKSRVSAVNGEIFAAQVRAARAIVNWSQAELARRTGLVQRSVHRIEQGESGIRPSTRSTIENAFASAGVKFESSPRGFTIAASIDAVRRSACR
jgi:transcriptional regulator with XRE-family HTH domain